MVSYMLELNVQKGNEEMKTLRNDKILFTGLTGQIGFPLAVELALKCLLGYVF